MNNDKAGALAAKIATLITEGAKTPDLNSIQNSLDHIIARLDKLESSQAAAAPKGLPMHPSQDRFAIAEAIVDTLFDRQSEEKACTFEPNAKPCDHCSMCSSRGF